MVMLETVKKYLRSGWVEADETWTYASADDPTFVITVPSGAASKYSVGMKIKLTQTTVRYFIITAVTDTTLTVYGGTDYDLADAAISANYYSLVKSPQGFPLDPDKWTYAPTVTDTTSAGFYNHATLNVPLGIWNTDVSVMAYVQEGSTFIAGDHTVFAALQISTYSSSFSNTYDQDLLRIYMNTPVTDNGIRLLTLEKRLVFPVKLFTSDGATTLYMVSRSTSNNPHTAKMSDGICRFTCAYL